MLLFRSEEHVERWCRQWKLPRGYVLHPDQCARLAHEWMHDRLDPAWRRKTAAEAEALFAEVGLTGDFWKLG